jgi:methionyl-tRNA formyltransferase
VRIVLFCATERGRQFLRKVRALLPDAQLDVVTFHEEPWEPPFYDAIRAQANNFGARFHSGGSSMPDLPNEFDLLFVVSWRHRIPASVYKQAGRGAFLFHDSLLPRYRGFSPTVWAIINGEDETGATLLELVEEIDAGAIVDQQRIPIGPEDTIATVLPKVTASYLEIFERNLPGIVDGTYPRRAQNGAEATYCCKRVPEDAKIAWSRPAAQIHNLIRAVTRPYTGAFTRYGSSVLRIWSCALANDDRRYAGMLPGHLVETVEDQGVRVLAGEGSTLLIREVSIDDGATVSAAKILQAGMTLGP